MGSSPDPVRVALAEDSVLLREGLTHLLAEEGFQVIAACDTADALLAHVDAQRPNIVLVDVRLPPSHTDEGLRAAYEIRSRWPHIGVLVLSQYIEVELASRLLARGPDRVGYLLKDRITHVAEFTAALRRVAEGGSALDPLVVAQLLALRQGDEDMRRLTRREREVLALMARGLSNQAIATSLVVSLRAVEKYVTAIFEKLDLPAGAEGHRRVLAVLKFLEA